MAVELATAYVNLVPSAKGITDHLTGALGAPLAAAATSSGETASAGFLGAFGAKLGALPGIVKAAFIGVAAFAPLAGLAALGSSFDEAFDKIRVGTGATGRELDGLESSFKQVAKSGPSSFGDVSDTITELSKRLGLTGKPLESLSKDFLDLSRITGTDLGGNVKAVTGLFNQFGVRTEDQSGKLNELFRVSQKTGVSVADLATSMSQGGAQFRAAGFSCASTAGLLGLLAKNGLDAGAVVPALSRAMATAAKDGKDASTVFRDVFDTIRNAPSDTEAAGAALDVFGARAGPKLAALIREGKLSYEEFAASIGSGDTISKAAADTDDWREALDTLKNTTLVALEPLATGVFNAITAAVKAITPAIQTAAGVIDIFFGAFTGGGGTEVEGISGRLASSVANIAFKARDLVNTAGPALVGFFRGLGDALAPLVTDWLPKVIGFFNDFFTTLSNNTMVVSTAGATIGFLKENLDKMVIALGGALLAVKAFQGLESITVALTSVVEGVGGIASLFAEGGLLAGAGAVALPVLAVVAAIAALAAGAVLAYQHFKPFRDAVDAVGRTLSGAFRASLEWIVDVAWPAIRTGAADAAAAFAGLGAATATAWRAFRDAIQPTIDWYNDHVGPTVAAATDLIIVVFDRLATAAQLVFIPLRALFETMASEVVLAFGIMTSVISGWVGVITPILGGFVEFATGIFGPFFTFVVSGFQTTFGLLADIVGGALDIIRGIIEIVTAVITLDWDKAWNGIKDIVAGVWAIIDGIIQAALAVITASITFSIGAVQAFLSAAWDTIKGVAQGAWDGFRDIIVNTANGVVTFVSQLPGRFVAALGDMLSLLVQKGDDLLHGLLTGAANKALDVAAWLGHLGADTVAWVGETIQTLEGRGFELITGFLIGAIHKVVDVVGWLGHLGHDAASWVGDLGRVLFDKGVQLIQGFIDGVQHQAAKIPGIVAAAVNPGLAIGNFVGGLFHSATGRYVAGPMVSSLGESGPEVVLNQEQGLKLLWNLANSPLIRPSNVAPGPAAAPATGSQYVYAPTVHNEITPDRVMDAFHTMSVLYG